MLEHAQTFAEWGAAIMEVLGVVIIAGLAIYALIYAGFQMARRTRSTTVFQEFRQRLGHGILLGLEFLVAADIIHTVAVELTFETVGVLAVIVLIRTFLSFTLEVELTGNWPWQNRE